MRWWNWLSALMIVIPFIFFAMMPEGFLQWWVVCILILIGVLGFLGIKYLPEGKEPFL